jgi:hypothetical protein
MIAGFITNGKPLLSLLLMPSLVVLVALAAFGLGRLSALKEGRSLLMIHSPTTAAESH